MESSLYSTHLSNTSLFTFSLVLVTVSFQIQIDKPKITKNNNIIIIIYNE